MTIEKLRYARRRMVDRTRSIPAVCRELGGFPTSTLYHYLAADGALKDPGRAAPQRASGSGATEAGRPAGCIRARSKAR